MNSRQHDTTHKPMAAELGIHKVTWEVLDSTQTSGPLGVRRDDASLKTVLVSLPYVSILEDETEHEFFEASE